MKKLRIFVSSPGDVAQERQLAERVLQRLDSEFGAEVSLESYFWEYEPMVITKDYQEQIPHPGDFDIVVCILWSRMGTRIHSHYVRPDGRNYRSGTEYEFVEAVEAQKMNDGVPAIIVCLNESELQISVSAPDFGERRQQWEDLQEFLNEWTLDSDEPVFRGALNKYSTLDEFEGMLETILQKQIRNQIGSESETVRSAPTWKGNPYQGLDFFDFEHEKIFFGRTRAVGGVLKALKSQADDGRAFVLVIGASGSGKSSLVRAGILPFLARPGTIEGVGLTKRAVLRPSEGGADPFVALASALLHENALPGMRDPEAPDPAETLAREIRSDPGAVAIRIKDNLIAAATQEHERINASLRDRIRKLEGEQRSEDAKSIHERIIDSQPPKARLLLVVDQMEELFSGGATEETLHRFMVVIDALARGGRVYVIGTLRSDFYAYCAKHETLMSLKEGKGTFHLGAPSSIELAQMIREPALTAGIAFESHSEKGNLDERILDAAENDADSLPLVEFCLERLFEEGHESGTLTHADYEAIGSLEGVLVLRAEEVFETLAEDEKEVFDDVMRLLVNLSEHERDDAIVRKVARYEDLACSSERRNFVETFVEARLFSASENAKGEATISVTHEALLHRWDRILFWTAENREFLRIRKRVATSHRQWVDSAPENKTSSRRDASFLLQGGKQLDEAEAQLAQHPEGFSKEQREYIEASSERVRSSKRRSTIAKLVGAVFLSLLAVTTSIGFWFAEKRAEEARIVRRQAEMDADALRARAKITTDGRRAQEEIASVIAAYRQIYPNKELSLTVQSALAAIVEEAREIGRIENAEVPGKAFRMALLGDDRTLALISSDWLEMIGVDKGESRNRISAATLADPESKEPPRFMDIAVLAEGNLVVAAMSDGAIHFFHPGQSTAVKSWRTGSSATPRFILYAKAAKQIVTIDSESMCQFWNTDGVEVRASVKLPDIRMIDISMDEQAQNLAMIGVSVDERARNLALIDAVEKKYWHRLSFGTGDLAEMVAFECSGGRFSSIVMSGDGEHTAIGFENGLVELWSGGHLVRTMSGHEAAVSKLAFCEADQKLVSGAEDGSIQYWNLDGNRACPPFFRACPSRVWFWDDRRCAFFSQCRDRKGKRRNTDVGHAGDTSGTHSFETGLARRTDSVHCLWKRTQPPRRRSRRKDVAS